MPSKLLEYIMMPQILFTLSLIKRDGTMMWHNSAFNQGESLSADYQVRIDFLLHSLSLYMKKDTVTDNI